MAQTPLVIATTAATTTTATTTTTITAITTTTFVTVKTHLYNIQSTPMRQTAVATAMAIQEVVVEATKMVQEIAML
jgi:hypothetical protein